METQHQHSALKSSERSIRHCRILAQAASLTAMVIGVLTLIGWVGGFAVLKTVLHGAVSMKVNTAIGFVLAGFALGLRVRTSASAPGTLRSQLARISSGAAAFLGLGTLAEYLLNINPGLDQIFLRQELTAGDTAPGRMAQATALGIALLGLAICFLDDKRVAVRRGAPACAFVAMLIGIIALVGYLYGVESLYRFHAFSSVALHTALLLFTLGLGVLSVRPDRPPLATITLDRGGGAMARRLMPIFLVPLGLGWLCLKGEQAGLYGTEFGLALFATSNVAVFSILVWQTANHLNRLDGERARVEEANRAAVTELQVANDHLLYQLRLTEEITEKAADSIFLIDGQGRVTFINPEAERVFGYSREELIGRMLHEAILRHDLEGRPASAEARPLEAIFRGAVGKQDATLFRKDGSMIQVVFSSAPLELEGREAGMMLMIHDLTARKKAEAELRQANEDLERRIVERTAELRSAKERAESADRLKSEFLANVSHELRTPLNGIIGFSEFLVDERPGKLNPKQKEYLGDVLSSGRHLLQLINDVLDLAKVEAGKMEFNPASFAPEAAIREVCAIVRGIAHKKQVSLEVTIAPELHQVTLDEQKFKQVLYNLISNGIKFTGEGGQVQIQADLRGGDRFAVAVRDTGIGIREQDLGRLFHEFEQLDSSATRPHGGSGLGLALTRKILERQGGWIEVKSVFGKGSLFTAVLPREASFNPELPHAGSGSD